MTRLKDAIVNLNTDEVKVAYEGVISKGIPAYRAVIDGMAKSMEIVG